MHFLFDFDNFPINDELINNVRVNQGRITPFDANNGGAYNIIDHVRNNAYGLYGQYQNFANTLDGDTWTFGEGGGPAQRRRLPDPAEPVQGGPLHREGQPGLAGRPVQPPQVRRRVHPVQDRQLHLPAGQTSSSRMPTSRSRSGGTASSKTGSTWVTWSWWAACGTTGTTPAPARPFATDTAGQHLRVPARDRSSPGFDPDNPTAVFVRGQEPQLPEPARPGVVPGDRPDQLPAVATRTRCRRRTSRCSWAASTPTWATPTPTRSTGPTSTSARRSPSSSASGTPSATTWCSTSPRTTRTSCPIRRPGWSRCTTRHRAATTTSGILTNLDFGNVRGIDVRLDRRFGNYFNGTLSATRSSRPRTPAPIRSPTSNYGSRIVNQVGRQQRRAAAAAGHPADRQQPAAHAGERRVSRSPCRGLAAGHDAGDHAPQCRRVRDVPLHQRHARTPSAVAGTKSMERRLGRQLRPDFPRGHEHSSGCPRSRSWNAQVHQGLRTRQAGPHRPTSTSVTC